MITIFVAGVMLCATAHADVQQKIAAAYQKGDFARAVTLAKPVATSDTPDHHAQTLLGLMYLKGQGVARSDEAAFKLLKSAHNFDMGASVIVGWMYLNAIGTEASDAKAAEAFQVPALADEDGDASQLLSWLYLNGRGVAADYSEAVAFSAKAVAAGRHELPALVESTPAPTPDASATLPAAVQTRMQERIDAIAADEVKALLAFRKKP
jgi:TPR repeat protein